MWVTIVASRRQRRTHKSGSSGPYYDPPVRPRGQTRCRIDLKKKGKKRKIWRRAALVPLAPDLAPTGSWKWTLPSPSPGLALPGRRPRAPPSHRRSCWRPRVVGKETAVPGTQSNPPRPPTPPPRTPSVNTPFHWEHVCSCPLPPSHGTGRGRPRRGRDPWRPAWRRAQLVSRPSSL